MNLYKLHSKPETLDYHAEAFNKVPALAWKKYRYQPKELKAREQVFVKDPELAYRYAHFVLMKPFPVGEAAIASDPEWAYSYACDVLKGPFPAGEAAIAKNAEFSYWYARLLNGPFLAGEAAIAANQLWAYEYACNVLDLSEAEADEWVNEPLPTAL